jgi:hypothetical protein
MVSFDQNPESNRMTIGPLAPARRVGGCDAPSAGLPPRTSTPWKERGPYGICTSPPYRGLCVLGQRCYARR